MLLQFKYANYRSFADEAIFDMTATPIREHRNSLIEQNGVQALPVAAFYGANASGKSSFFMAFDTMRRLVLGADARRSRERELIKPYSHPFIFDSNYFSEATEFEISIAINGSEYRYGYEYTEDRILCEYLYKRKLSKNETVEKMLFERVGGDVKSEANHEILKEVEYCASMSVEHSLLLTDLGRRRRIAEFSELYGWFRKTVSSFQFASSSFFPLSFIEDAVGEVLSSTEPHDIEMAKDMLNLITEMDKSIFLIRVVEADDDDSYLLKSIHQCGGTEIEVPFSIESDGTKRLLGLSYYIIAALYHGICCFIDELDLQLHPLLLRKIVHMFKNKDINKHGAQLIFSAHNIINLDSSDLRRDEVWFVEKNNRKSSLFSLYDYEDEENRAVRSDLSYGKHYLLGRFGAIPFQDRAV